MPESLQFDPNELTIGDLEDFEDVTGKSLDQVFKSGTNGSVSFDAKTLKALIWIVKRRDNPEFTLDDARGVKVGELEIVNDERPTTAASSKSGRRSATSTPPTPSTPSSD